MWPLGISGRPTWHMSERTLRGQQILTRRWTRPYQLQVRNAVHEEPPSGRPARTRSPWADFV